MADATCTVQDCLEPPKCRGWCGSHYARWRRHGDPCGGGSRRAPDADVEAYFWTKVDRHGPVPPPRLDLGRCWLWTGPVNSSGYGSFSIAGRSLGAHRAGWRFADGAEIPRGKVLDHLCQVRRCVRPDHLEVVAQWTNTRRGTSPVGPRSDIKVCAKGHTLEVAGTRKSGSIKRFCRTCTNQRQRNLRAGLSQGETKHPPTALTDDLLLSVAAIFSAAVANDQPPVVAVAGHFGRPYSTVFNWIKKARAKGLISRESARRGYAGLPVGPVVYFAERDNLIKIGYSDSLSRRLSGLAHEPTGPGAAITGDVQLLAAIPGDRKMERRLHERFAAQRVVREWFSPSPELNELITELAL